MDDSENERYRRWQDYRIQQLSFAINLFLGFAVASLAFAINLSVEKTLSDLRIPILWWSGSAFCGCVATVSRLLDFRATAAKILSGGKMNSFIAKYAGGVTWGVFWWQLGLYGMGVYFFVDRALRV